jgi:putative inorganic carbon (hco3(-)) transporter
VLEAIGMLAACGGAAAALLLEDRRARQAAIAIALLAAPVLVLGNVWDEPRVVEFRSSAGELGAAVAIATIGVAALVAAFRRFPAAFPIIAVAVLPLRVPVEIGGETANLLVPLYLVIAAAFIASVLSEHLPPSPERPDPWALWLRRLLAATLLLYAIQAIYSEDVANAIENIGFFLVPFAILFRLLAEVRWSRALLRWTLVGVAVVAAGAAAIAIYQYFARDLFLNPELFDSNELHAYFRTNSIFFDPNILGRYLALAITALAACIAWGGSRRELGLAALVCALGLIGLAFSYSITSFAALLAGLATVAVLRFGWTGAAAFAGLGLAGLAALAIAGGTPTSDIEDYRSIDSGHADLIEGGLDLARDRPVAGWGSGSFGRAFYDRIEPARTTVSHSEPITVAAEQGAIGFALYVGLIVTALATLLGGGVRSSLARSAIGACFVAMLVSSFGYTGFVIDPAVWALLALGVATRRDPPEASATI